MLKKINIAIFANSKDLSDEIIKKILEIKKKLNIVLVVSDIKFKEELEKNNLKNFIWLKNNKNNSLKVCKVLNNFIENNIYAFSLQHKWKVEKKVIEKFKMFINFHYGDIPNYRGHNPVIHAILNNEKFLYGTIHSIDEELDKGLIIGKVKVINDKTSSKNLERKITIKMADYFKHLIIKIINKRKITLKKIKSNKNKFYNIKDIQKLKEVKKFKDIINKTCAFDYEPHEPAYIKIKDTKIYLRLKPN